MKKKRIIPKHRFQAVFGPTRPWLRLPPKRELNKKKNHIQLIHLQFFIFSARIQAKCYRASHYIFILIFAKCCMCFGITKKIIQETWNAMLHNFAKHASGIRTTEPNLKTLNHSALGRSILFLFLFCLYSLTFL